MSTLPLNEIFVQTSKLIGQHAWEILLAKYSVIDDPETVLSFFTDENCIICPEFASDLALVEWKQYQILQADCDFDSNDAHFLNPTLDIVQSKWNLVDFLNTRGKQFPQAGDYFILLWKHPVSNKTVIHTATDRDLLIIKILAENMRLEDVAEQGALSLGQLHDLMLQAVSMGYVVGPSPKISRSNEHFILTDRFKRHRTLRSFTIQWHITHACDLHCKHCYDRSKRSPLILEQGMNILQQFESFCWDNQVRGHVCFTGGNPFLSPHFFELYQSAANHGFGTSILGNPVPREKVVQMVAIQKPTYYQVSLEGLPKHNDYIRGQGNFSSVIEFLGVLRDVDIIPSVMLTLTRDNIDQVLPLGERLRGHAKRLNFNRLSQVGEGADLMLPSKETYLEFLRQYVEASKTNPVLCYKDNLLNPILEEKDYPLFGGCTSYGCGAAFSFLTLLPDGEVHACRKFPSPLGNVLEQNLSDIFGSDLAERYRQGTAGCADCELKLVCGGCMALAASSNCDIFTQHDPFCPLDTVQK